MGKKDQASTVSTVNFKTIAITLLENKGKWKDVAASLKGAFTARVFNDSPALLFSDGSFFIGAYLTQDAFDKYRSKFKTNHISKSEGTNFRVEDWHMEVVKVNSEDTYTSYADREIRLIIKSLVPTSENIESKNFVENLHRDNDVKLYISRYNHEEIQE